MARGERARLDRSLATSSESRCLTTTIALPELGPRLLFLSGGSAPRQLCRRLKTYTHNSIHLITPFDSGGSSASLRTAFGILSVGDLRNRLIALADESLEGSPEIYRLFAHRLARFEEPQRLVDLVERLIDGTHEFMHAVPEAPRLVLQRYLKTFFDHVDDSFDLRGASLGNLLLVGGYVDHGRDFDAVLNVVGQAIAVRGVVRPVVEDPWHLEAILADGRRIVGQHAISGKESAELSSPIENLRLVDQLNDARPATSKISPRISQYIASADLICLPMGSFWTSIVASLLPGGVGRSLAAQGCPKVFVPNLGHDPESLGMSVADQVGVLLEVLRKDSGSDLPAAALLDSVLVDPERGRYEHRFDAGEIEAHGVRVVRRELVRVNEPTRYDPILLSETLVSLAGAH